VDGTPAPKAPRSKYYNRWYGPPDFSSCP